MFKVTETPWCSGSKTKKINHLRRTVNDMLLSRTDLGLDAKPTLLEFDDFEGEYTWELIHEAFPSSISAGKNEFGAVEVAPGIQATLSSERKMAELALLGSGGRAHRRKLKLDETDVIAKDGLS
jgi:hypothetical protein